MLIYFNGTAIVVFFKIPFAASASVFFYNLALDWKEVKSLVFPISLIRFIFRLKPKAKCHVKTISTVFLQSVHDHNQI